MSSNCPATSPHFQSGWALSRQAPPRRDWPGLLVLAAQHSPHLAHYAKVAAEVCKACEDECTKHVEHPPCKACADACKACAAECAKVAA